MSQESSLTVEDIFHPDAKFKINTIIRNIYKLDPQTLEPVLENPTHAFLINYYLGLSLEADRSLRKMEEVETFVKRLSFPSIVALWNVEGCSLSIKLTQNSNYRSYFYFLPEASLVQLLFHYYQLAKDVLTDVAMIRKARKKLFNILPLLSIETIQNLYEFTFLGDLTAQLDEILNIEEIRYYASHRPDLFTKIQFDDSHQELNYTKTLMTQNSMEWQDTYQMLHDEAQATKKKFTEKPDGFHQENFQVRNGKLFFTIDYLFTIIKLFRDDQREFVFNKIARSSLKAFIRPVDMEVLPILISRLKNGKLNVDSIG